MKHGNILLCVVCLFSLLSCKQHSESVKHYDALSNIKNVKEHIHEISTGDIAISDFGKPFILNDYLIISDYKSFDKLIYVFDKNTFTYLANVGDRGQGPSEIANMGSIIPDEKNNAFYVFDHGHQLLYDCPMDSVLSNPNYLPKKKADIDPSEFPFKMQSANGTCKQEKRISWNIQAIRKSKGNVSVSQLPQSIICMRKYIGTMI